jgi:hypothetical protein
MTQWRDARALFVRGGEIFAEIRDAREQFIAAVRERNRLQIRQKVAAREIEEIGRFGFIPANRANVIDVATAEIERLAGLILSLNEQIDTQRERYDKLTRELRAKFDPVMTDPEVVRISLPRIDELVRADGVLVR